MFDREQGITITASVPDGSRCLRSIKSHCCEMFPPRVEV